MKKRWTGIAGIEKGVAKKEKKVKSKGKKSSYHPVEGGKTRQGSESVLQKGVLWGFYSKKSQNFRREKRECFPNNQLSPRGERRKTRRKKKGYTRSGGGLAGSDRRAGRGVWRTEGSVRQRGKGGRKH